MRYKLLKFAVLATFTAVVLGITYAITALPIRWLAAEYGLASAAVFTVAIIIGAVWIDRRMG